MKLLKGIKKAAGYLYVPIDPSTAAIIYDVHARQFYSEPNRVVIKKTSDEARVLHMQEDCILAFIEYNKHHLRNELTPEEIRAMVQPSMDGDVMVLDSPVCKDDNMNDMIINLKLYGLRVHPTMVEFRWKALPQQPKAVQPIVTTHGVGVDTCDRKELTDAWEPKVISTKRKIDKQIQQLQSFTHSLDNVFEEAKSFLSKPQEWNISMEKLAELIDSCQSGFIVSARE